MDAHTEQMIVTIGGGIAKKALMLQAAGLVSHGLLSANNTEVFVSLGLAAIGAAWSFWNDFGKAIVLSQLEVLKAKSLAQAEKMRNAGVSPVTATQIADQSPNLTTSDVTKTVATMAPEIQANIVPMIVKILLAAFALSFLLAGSPASAQTRIGPIGQKVASDLGVKPADSGLGSIISKLAENQTVVPSTKP